MLMEFDPRFRTAALDIRHVLRVRRSSWAKIVYALLVVVSVQKQKSKSAFRQLNVDIVRLIAQALPLTQPIVNLFGGEETDLGFDEDAQVELF
jgi:hypothetical protein